MCMITRVEVRLAFGMREEIRMGRLGRDVIVLEM